MPINKFTLNELGLNVHKNVQLVTDHIYLVSIRPGRLPKVESFESRDTLHPRSLRPPVFKSHSFGGYSGGVTVLSRGDSVSSNISSRLSKQGIIFNLILIKCVINFLNVAVSYIVLGLGLFPI